ncbi:hypothetical protein GBAR_LOCUS23250 [Geodia barretti]|uniref:Uncharacterized protein n=1 Tax=Geodia barretti TaxID=519541 RepID=A0AA35T6J6_GEOBA|nr:hypothetical protein GBAR_LOCUS23250 [Geodia barretti]
MTSLFRTKKGSASFSSISLARPSGPAVRDKQLKTEWSKQADDCMFFPHGL